ncbi:tagatose kinase [Bradyrhizobium iriomotense]|uniref:Sugar kinase n=1 Tax=Bradyrhizobium iriomotense TaxID=441950 RepID=A0ABQ6AW47_9BRAD|nr:sugar kinase [Bradyrhizobium iriomotense]GLR85234.1 sugar kinase [Bradyrhizobium iriomotense]
MTKLAPDALGPTITVGEILVEIVATTEGEGFLEPLDLIGPFPSGAPAIFIDQCARIGGSAAMVGAVGDDDFGQVNIRRLQRDGVDVSAVSVSTDHPTGSAFVRYRPDGTRDFVFNIAKSAAALLEWTTQLEMLVSRAGHLHIMGTVLAMPSAWEITKRAADIIRARGGSLSLDPNLRKELIDHGQVREQFKQLVEMADLILPSGEELVLAAGVQDERAAVQSLFQRGANEIVIKRGRAGSTYYDRHGARIDCPAFLVDELDPTGAGDCFGGAYVGCRRLGMAPAQALNYANAAGARNVTVRGPMEGAGTRAELDDFMARTARASS